MTTCHQGVYNLDSLWALYKFAHFSPTDNPYLALRAAVTKALSPNTEDPLTLVLHFKLESCCCLNHK